MVLLKEKVYIGGGLASSDMDSLAQHDVLSPLVAIWYGIAIHTCMQLRI